LLPTAIFFCSIVSSTVEELDMNTIAKLAAAALASSVLLPDVVLAQSFFFTVACLHNQTKYNIRYSDSQNSGRFTPSSLTPGQTMTYSLKYPRVNQKSTLRVIVRYDADGSNAGRFSRDIRLQGYASTGQSCREGKQYAFRPEPRDGRMIRIVAID
jgi:hypothetical protein